MLPTPLGVLATPEADYAQPRLFIMLDGNASGGAHGWFKQTQDAPGVFSNASDGEYGTPLDQPAYMADGSTDVEEGTICEAVRHYGGWLIAWPILSSSDAITSINGQKGPAITLQSSDGSIVFAEPEANVIDLHSCPDSSNASGYAEFTDTGTWTAPACVTSVYVECWGEGGDGGSNEFGDSFGGGGGGAYAAGWVAVVPGTTYEIDAIDGVGSSGSSMRFNHIDVVAVGGQYNGGGSYGTGLGGQASDCTGAIRFSGGNGGAGVRGGVGDYQVACGGGGGAAGPDGDGSNGTDGTISGNLPVAGIGGSGYSAGGDGGYFDATDTLSPYEIPGASGQSPGGGGGGGWTDLAIGGAGGVFCRISWGSGVTSMNGTTGNVLLKGVFPITVNTSESTVSVGVNGATGTLSDGTTLIDGVVQTIGVPPAATGNITVKLGYPVWNGSQWSYQAVKQMIDPSSGNYIAAVPALVWTGSGNPLLFELNGNYVKTPSFTNAKLRGVYAGVSIWDFDRCCRWAGNPTTRWHTVDAYLIALVSKHHTLDAYLGKRESRYHTIDAYLASLSSRTHSIDSYLGNPETKTHTLDAWLGVLRSKTHTADAQLGTLRTKTHTVDAWLLSHDGKYHTANAWLLSHDGKYHTIDSLLDSLSNRTHTADTWLGSKRTRSHTADASLAKKGSRTHTCDSYLSVIPYAVEFVSANSQFISVGNVLGFDHTDTFSLSFWFNSTQTTSNGGFVGKWNPLTGAGYFVAHIGGKLYFQVQSATGYLYYLSSVGANDGNWHFAVCTYDGSATLSGIKVYLDGSLQTSSDGSYASSGTLGSMANTQNFCIGSRGGGADDPSYWLNGIIDELHVYDIVVDSTWVTTNYNGGAGVRGASGESGLAAGWHFDEGGGDSASDYSGNGNTGALENGVEWVTGIS